MKQKANLKNVATVLLSSVMMTLSSMAFTLETNGNNIAPVHAEEQVEVDAKSTISDDVYTLAGSSAENNVYSFENPTYVSGYIMDGDSEVDCSSFEEFFLRAGSNNMKGTFYIVDDFIELNNPVEIPEGLDVTFAPAEGYSGTIEIFGNGLQDCSFFSIPTGSSLTLLGNFILDGSNDGYGYGNDYVRAFDVKGGTLNLGEKNNLDEYPVIHGFTGAAEFANGDGCGGAIYVNGGTINIYNAQLLDNPGNYDGGAIFATNSTVNFYNGETMNNASGVCMVDSLFNMYGGIIRDVFVLSSSCAKVENGIVESFNLFSSHVFYTNGGYFNNNDKNLTSLPFVWRSEYIFKYWSNSESLETAETSLVYGIHYAKWEQIVIGYTKEGNIETPYSSFDKFFDFVRNTPNKQGTLYINDIELVEPIIIPEGFDITLVANNANGVEILTEVAECDAFSIPTNSSLTLLGNITLIGPGQLVSNGYDQFVRAFRVEGTLNLGDLDNQGEYPTIQGFSGDGIIPNDDLFYGGAAIYAYGGTINIYNAHLMNNYVMETSNRANVGGAIYMIESTLNFYNGEIRENYARYAGGAIFARSSTLNMHGGYIVGNASEEAEGVVYLSDSFFNVYDGFINDNLCTGNGNAIQVYLNNSVAMIVGGDIELNDTDVYDSYVFHTYGGEFENNQLNPKEFPVATRRGYTFEYWRESASSGTAATKFGCGIYYAKWKKLDNFFDSISSYRGSGGYTAPSKEGQIFAGWYEDAEFTTPIPKNATSGSAFEKFVDAKVMDVKAQITAGTTEYSTSTNMRIVSTVDSLMYSDAGFMITINKTTKQISCKKVFTKLVAKDGGTVFDYAPTYFSESSKYFTTYTINNIPKANFGTAIKITPYWVTMDGTMVKGNEVIKTVYDCLG